MDLFELEINTVFNEQQLNELNKLPVDLKSTLEKFIKDIQVKHETLKTDYIKKVDHLGKF